MTFLAFAAALTCTAPVAYDVDTVNCVEGHRIRLTASADNSLWYAGIELDCPRGEEGRDALQDAIEDADTVRWQKAGTDRWGRVVAVLWVDGENWTLSAEAARYGWAVPRSEFDEYHGRCG